MVTQGGQGRITKGRLLKKDVVVAVKERLKDNKETIKIWNREVEILKMLEESSSCLTTARLICVLDDTPTKVSQKYIVMEWIDGQNLRGFDRKKLSSTNFETEADFMRMMLLLLNELKYLHSMGIIHRDIKPENCMVYERNRRSNFILIDFGCYHNLFGKEEKVLLERDDFKPPEINSEVEEFKSDVYAMGKTFWYVAQICKITLDEPLKILLNDMIQPELEKRPSVDTSIETLLYLCVLSNVKADVVDFMALHRGKDDKQYKQAKICDNFEEIRKEFVANKQVIPEKRSSSRNRSDSIGRVAPTPITTSPNAEKKRPSFLSMSLLN